VQIAHAARVVVLGIEQHDIGADPTYSNRGIARYLVSNLIASCAQPDRGTPSNEVPGR
jgi:ribosomal protein S18 acetylase RimI-like enzyme